jgi:hypothetical protein
VFTLLLFQSHLREILDHKLLALRAIAIGWASLLLLATTAAPKLAELDFWLHAVGWADIRQYWSGEHGWFAHFLIVGLLNMTVGYIVGRCHRRYRAAMVLAFFLSLTLFFDMPRVVVSVIELWGQWERLTHFFGIALVDFVLLRLPILAGGICGIRD